MHSHYGVSLEERTVPPLQNNWSLHVLIPSSLDDTNRPAATFALPGPPGYPAHIQQPSSVFPMIRNQVFNARSALIAPFPLSARPRR